MLAAVQAPALASASQSLPAPAHYSSSGCWKRLRATLPPRRRRRTAAPPTAATAASSAASPQAARPGDQYFAGGDVRVRRLVCCLHPAAARSVAFCIHAGPEVPPASVPPAPVISVLPPCFPPHQPQPIILFDGVCNLCNGGVNTMLALDRRGVFRFAALQSECGEPGFWANCSSAGSSTAAQETGATWSCVRNKPEWPQLTCCL